MKRLRFLSLAALVAFAACDQGTTSITPPPVEGSITGTVTIEGTAASGVSVSLSSGSSTTTDGSGSFSFSNVPAGAYTVSISGFASDATFSSTSQGAVISSAGQTVTVNFDGSFVRTASISGAVSAGGSGLSGVTVVLSGQSSGTATTGDGGSYAFTGLRAGSYTVSISGFDGGEYSFSSTSASVSVGAGEAKTASFAGTLKATAKIIGSVLVEGQAQEGVTVTMSGDGSGSTTTNASGAFEFSGLTVGTYTVTISGFVDDAEFGSNESTTTIASASSVASVEFSGTFRKTSSVSGQVAVGSSGIANVIVTMTGSSSVLKDTTSASGQYAFTGLRKGDYTLEISGFDATEYSFSATSQAVSLAVDESKVVNFGGMLQATAGISGTVTVEGMAVSGATVTLSGDASATDTTDSNGTYSFAGLKAGEYSVAVTAGGPSDATFSSVPVSIASAADSKTADIGGTYIRTSAISGSVTGEGAGLAGVTVTLSGVESNSTTTDANGAYTFTGLRAGSYTLTITGFDAATYTFATTSGTASPAAGETKVVSFAGTELTTATIMGSLFIDENAKDDAFTTVLEDKLAVSGVTVTLTGPTVGTTATTTTDASGDYSFANLKKGNYTVAISPADANLAGRAVVITTASASQSVTGLAIGGTQEVDFPFDITTESVTAYAYLGTDGVNPGITPTSGVLINIYDTEANATAAGAGGLLGSATTGTDGSATITYARANETNPAGGASDNIVFAQVTGVAGADIPANHVLNGENIIEIAYSAKDSMAAPSDTFDVLNKKVVIGMKVVDLTGAALAGWNTMRQMTDTTTAVTNASTDATGMVYFTRSGTPPDTFYLRVKSDQTNAKDGGHAYSQSPTANEAAAAGRYLKFAWDGTLVGGDTVMAGTATVSYDDSDVKIQVYHEADDTAGMTGGDDFLSIGSVTVNLVNSSSAVVATGSPAAGTGLLTFAAVPTGQTYSLQATNGSLVKRMLADSTVSLTLDGSVQATATQSFAYKFTDARIKGTILSVDGVTPASGVAVRITPTGSNIQPGVTEVWDTTNAAGNYNTGATLVEGPYYIDVSDVTGTGGDPVWSFLGRTADTVDLQSTAGPPVVSAVYRRNFNAHRMDTQIQGQVINDRDADITTIDPNEALSGAIVQLYRDSGITGTVSATDTLVATDTTDSNGAYSFSMLREDNYVVQVTSSSATVLRALSAAGAATNWAAVLTAASAAAASPADGANSTNRVGTTDLVAAGTALPIWNYSTDAAANVTTTHFTFLFSNGTIQGNVTNNGTGTAISGVRVTLTQCFAAGAAPPTPTDANCATGGGAKIAGTVQNVDTDSNGDYSFTNLSEGVYQVEITPTTVGLTTINTPLVNGSWLVTLKDTGDVETGNFAIS